MTDARPGQQWYLERQDKRHGPYTLPQLRELVVRHSVSLDDILVPMLPPTSPDSSPPPAPQRIRVREILTAGTTVHLPPQRPMSLTNPEGIKAPATPPKMEPVGGSPDAVSNLYDGLQVVRERAHHHGHPQNTAETSPQQPHWTPYRKWMGAGVIALLAAAAAALAFRDSKKTPDPAQAPETSKGAASMNPVSAGSPPAYPSQLKGTENHGAVPNGNLRPGTEPIGDLPDTARDKDHDHDRDRDLREETSHESDGDPGDDLSADSGPGELTPPEADAPAFGNRQKSLHGQDVAIPPHGEEAPGTPDAGAAH